MPPPLGVWSIHLLDDSFENILKKAGLKSKDNTDLAFTYYYEMRMTEFFGKSDFVTKADEAVQQHIIKTTTTDFEGRSQFEPVPPGDYYVYGMTQTRGGVAIWDMRIKIKPRQNQIMLDQNNADTAI